MNITGRALLGSSLIVLAGLYAGTALAAGSITILSPKDGAVIKGGAAAKLEYNVQLSPNGNHLHVYVDNGDPIIARKVSGCPCTIELPAMSPGKHEIVIKEATSSHAMTGLEAHVSVEAK